MPNGRINNSGRKNYKITLSGGIKLTIPVNIGPSAYPALTLEVRRRARAVASAHAARSPLWTGALRQATASTSARGSLAARPPPPPPRRLQTVVTAQPPLTTNVRTLMSTDAPGTPVSGVAHGRAIVYHHAAGSGAYVQPWCSVPLPLPSGNTAMTQYPSTM